MSRLGVLAGLALVASASLSLTCSTGGEGEDAAAVPSLTSAQLRDPASCKACHEDHYREWSGSMHAYAAEDPVFLAMNARGQRETDGALGTFCVGCHAPMAVRDGATKDGLNLASLPPSQRGVTCFFCHSTTAVDGAHNNPLRLADDGVMRGEIQDPVKNTAHRAAYSPLHDRDREGSSALCGACHDIVTGHGAHIERTFQEWKGSVFAGPGGATCSQCHMEQSATLVPIAQAPGVFARRFKGHTFAAVDVALTPFPEQDTQKQKVKGLLDTTLQTALCVSSRGGTTSVRVLADNVAAGHGFPSGSAQDRRLWAEVVASREGQVIYQSGVVPEGGVVTALGDPDLWLIRDCIFDPQGKEAHMFWEAASFEGNTFPGQVTFDRLDRRFYQHFVQAYPRAGTFPGVPDRVTLRLRLQPIGLDVLDDLVASGDLAASVRGAMPTFDLGQAPLVEWTPPLATSKYFDERIEYACVTNTAMNVAADKIPALTRQRCTP